MTPFLYRHPIEAHTLAPDLTDAEREVVERLDKAPDVIGGDALLDHCGEVEDDEIDAAAEFAGLDGYDRAVWP